MPTWPTRDGVVWTWRAWPSHSPSTIHRWRWETSESARRSRSSSYIVLFGATSRMKDDGLGSVRSLAMWLSTVSVGLQPALAAAARRQLSALAVVGPVVLCCCSKPANLQSRGHRITAAVLVAPARIMTLLLSSSPGGSGRARATSCHVVLDGGGVGSVGCEVPWWHEWPFTHWR